MFSACHHILVAVDLALLAFVINTGFREEAGTMEVEIWVEVLLIELVDQRCPALQDMRIAKAFSHHGTIFTFRQCIVVTMV